MAQGRSHAERVALLLAAPGVKKTNPPRPAIAWPLHFPEPADLQALYAVCDGVETDTGVRAFGRGELADVTQWLVLEKGLSWPSDLVVVGERRDVVVVLDLDVGGERAGGGVLEVGTDDLGAFERIATDVVGYLCERARVPDSMAPPPETRARRAAEARDREALEQALALPMYPGSARTVAPLAFALGTLHADADDRARALAAFRTSVDARVATVGRGGREAERVAAWTAAEHACRSRGRAELAATCASAAAKREGA